VEQFLKSRNAQIAAAAAFAFIVALVVWRIADRPSTETAGVAPAVQDSNKAMENGADTSRDVAGTGEPPVTQSLPKEPDPNVADVGPAADATEPQTTAEPGAYAAPPVVVAPPKYANAVPDKSPPRAKEDAQQPSKAAPALRRMTEQTVMHVRRLKTQLEVAALSCRHPRMTSNYNTFVTKFDRNLKANGQALKSYFTSRFGARGVTEMDAFLTKLANEISLVSLRRSDFCERSDGLFDTVLALPTNDIESFADRYLSQPVVARDGF
jgi:hypothetical protein